MNRLPLRRRLALGAAVGLLTSTLASCNAIFGISPGIGTGGATSSTGSSGTGGFTIASSSAGNGASSSGTGGTPSSTTTTGTGGTAPDAGPLKCDGTDPGGTDGKTAKWAVSAFNATGMGVGLPSSGRIVIGGTYQGNATVFGSAPLPVADAGGGDSANLFLTYYLNGKNYDPTAFVGPGTVGTPTDGMNINTAVLMAVDAQGRIAIGGNFQGTFTLGDVTLTSDGATTDGGSAQPLDGFVALFDASFHPVWPPKRLGSPLNDAVNSVAIDSQGNVLVLSMSNVATTATTFDAGCGAMPAPVFTNPANGVYISKIKLDGTCAWHDSFSIDNSYIDSNNDGAGLALTVDLHDDVVIAGGAIPGYSILDQGTLGHDMFNSHAFVAKLQGADGSVAWQQAFENGNQDTQSFFAVTTDPCGNVLVGGNYSGGATFGSLPMLTDPMGADDLDRQGVLVKLDPDGNPLWQQVFKGRGWTGVTAIAVNHASDIALVGMLQDNPSSAGIDFLGTMLLPPTPLNVGETDFYVAKLKGDGSLRWVGRYGGLYYDAVGGVALDDAGHVGATGYFSSPIDFGSGVTVTPEEDYDFWAVEFGP